VVESFWFHLRGLRELLRSGWLTLLILPDIFMSHNLFITSDSLDTYRHLAVEATLVERLGRDDFVVYCWNSRPSIVIGKNQNCWKECDVRACRERDVTIARRVSGGGAVYHGPGNFNVSIFSGRDRYDREFNFSLLIETLRRFGIEVSVGEHHALVSGGRKLSGSAFCEKKNAALHHATLLLDADLGSLRSLLKPSFPGLIDRTVASHPQPVVNCADLADNVTADRISEVLRAVAAEYLPEPLVDAELSDLLPRAVFDMRYAEMSRTEWNFHYRADFTLPLQAALDEGELRINLEIGGGVVKEFVMLLCPVPENTVVCILKRLIGVAFNHADISAALSKAGSEQEYAPVRNWLLSLPW
jgi:lipoate-protein ligase A